MVYLHQAQVLLGSKFGFSRLIERWRSNHLQEKLGHFFRSLAINGPVYADNSAESRNRIALQRFLVSLDKRFGGGGSRGVGVLDNGANRFLKLLSQVPCRL